MGSTALVMVSKHCDNNNNSTTLQIHKNFRSLWASKRFKLKVIIVACLLLLGSLVTYTALHLPKNDIHPPFQDTSSRSNMLHIVFGADTSEIVIVWADHICSSPKVFYGSEGTMLPLLDDLVEAQCSYLRYENEYGSPVWIRAAITDLRPSTLYFYQVQNAGKSSDIKAFTTPKRGGSSPQLFLVFGDLGTKSKSIKDILKEAKQGDYTAVLHAGNIACDLHSNKGKTGDLFLKDLTHFSTHVPYLTAPGESERSGQFEHYRTRFSMPNVDWPMPMEQLFYSIDIGLMHLISYNTEVFFSSENEINAQLKWLSKDLETANKNRGVAPWVVVMGNRPLYCSSQNKDCIQGNKNPLRNLVEDLFYTGGVDLVIQSHSHMYERTWPVYKDKTISSHYVNPLAPVFVSVGSPGYQYSDDKFSSYLPEWSAYRMSYRDAETIGRMSILNKTHLHWQTAKPGDSNILDHFVIKQTKHGAVLNDHKSR